MKRKKIIVAAFVMTGCIIAILLYNKSRMEAKSENDIVKSVPVTVSIATKQQINDSHSLEGTIAANNDVAVVSETQGKITGVEAEIGQYKTAGSVLIQIDDELKKANLASAETNYEKAQKDLERFESLSKENAATDQQVESERLAKKAAEAQYITSRREYTDTKICTPISGIVTARPYDIGAYIQKGTVVANVIDISRLKVKLNIAESDVFRLKVGDKVEVGTDVYPGIVFTGQVHTISSKGDDAHTYPVEVILENNNSHPLKAGMFARVTFSTLSHDRSLTIPRGALIGSVKHAQVFVVSNGIAHLRDIVLGNEYGASFEVLKGLNESDTLVNNGQNNLKDNTSVTIIK